VVHKTGAFRKQGVFQRNQYLDVADPNDPLWIQEPLSLGQDRRHSDGMGTGSSKCPICNSTASVEVFGPHAEVLCVRCGDFSFTPFASQPLQELNPRQITVISAWIRENPGVMIKGTDLPKLYELGMPTVGEKAEKILLHLAKKFPNPGTEFDIFKGEILAHEFQAVGWASDFSELLFLLKEFLWHAEGLVEYIEEPTDEELKKYWQITPKGWLRLDSLRRGNPQSVIGFIAMWFNDSMNSAYTAIEHGIRAAGYSPHRIDQKQHNNKIDDEIIAGIRRSKFLVADFTGHRGGVYFEAGFAKGLGLEVIWLCRKDDLEKLHFDTRQYSHITWQEDDLPALTKALKDRIEATIGHGPIE
jgi:hypothetical protein